MLVVCVGGGRLWMGVSYVIDVVCTMAFVLIVDILMCVVCAVRVGFICVCCKMEWPCGGVWVLCVGLM